MDSGCGFVHVFFSFSLTVQVLLLLANKKQLVSRVFVIIHFSMNTIS